MPSPTTSRGFTLVELLVVIGIIAVLVAMLLPMLSKARQAAKQVQCISNIRQLALGFTQYAMKYNGVIPSSHTDGSSSKYWMSWFEAEADFRPLVAGEYRHEAGKPSPPGKGEYGGTRVKCPNNSLWYGQGAFNGVSYALMYSSSRPDAFQNTTLPGWKFHGRRIQAIRQPDKSILVIDSATGGVGQSPVRLYMGEPMPGISVNYLGYGNRGGTLDRVWFSHPKNTTTAAFVDGHAEMYTISQMLRTGMTYYWNNQGQCFP